MLQLRLPYGKTFLPLEMEENRIRAVLTSELERYIPGKTPEDLVRSLHMLPAKDLSEALTLAGELLQDPNAAVTVIPDGLGVIVL